jgi:hypothetical protein
MEAAPGDSKSMLRDARRIKSHSTSLPGGNNVRALGPDDEGPRIGSGAFEYANPFVAIFKS